jgi:hypothetical protein
MSDIVEVFIAKGCCVNKHAFPRPRNYKIGDCLYCSFTYIGGRLNNEMP